MQIDNFNKACAQEKQEKLASNLSLQFGLFSVMRKAEKKTKAKKESMIYYRRIWICPYISTISFFPFTTHCWLLCMHQNFVFHVWASIIAFILLRTLLERASRLSKMVPHQMSNAMVFISNDGRTQTAETRAWDSKILIAFPARAFQEVFKTHLLF